MRKFWVSGLFIFASLTVVKSQVKVYSNYDFVPGTTVLFEDNFKDGRNGEFPAKWNLESGQGAINEINGESALFMTANAAGATVSPRMKTPSYLTDPFTIEFDYYIQADKKNGVHLFFQCSNKKTVSIYFGESGNVLSEGFVHNFDGTFPNRDAKFEGQWHHVELIFKSGQIKTYVDKLRVTNLPGNAGVTPVSVKVGGEAWTNNPIIIRNFRIASGGMMNMAGAQAGKQNVTQPMTTPSISSSSQSPQSANLKVYNDYDFVPGDNVLFEDNFRDDQDGEYPAKWDLESGQGVINQLNGEPAFFLTANANQAIVSPTLKSESYLTDPFTVEFDYYVQTEKRSGVHLFLTGADHKIVQIYFGERGNMISTGLTQNFNTPFLDGTVPFNNNQWHHGAMIFKGGQMKTYIDQYRIVVVPGAGVAPVSLKFGGEAWLNNPIIIKNVRIALGGSMNTIDKKFTDSKIVTHGINFDYGKSTLRPESMGTLNMIKEVMTNNPELRFEIDGHTDNDGGDAYNLKLSQDRAEAVKLAMIDLGIDGTRFTTKGYGLTKPIGDNNTPEGRANNRRVEFVKL